MVAVLASVRDRDRAHSEAQGPNRLDAAGTVAARLPEQGDGADGEGFKDSLRSRAAYVGAGAAPADGAREARLWSAELADPQTRQRLPDLGASGWRRGRAPSAGDGSDPSGPASAKQAALTLCTARQDASPPSPERHSSPGAELRSQPRHHWSPEEDDILRQLVATHGPRNWTAIAEYLPLRSGKSCRLRWINQLDPRLVRGPFTKEEEAVILAAHRKYGNRWSTICTFLPGRTDNAVKNHWHSSLGRIYKQIVSGGRVHLLASLEDAIASLEAAQSRAAGKTGGGPGADAPVRSPQARPSTADRITALVGGKERGDSPAPRDRAGQGGPAGEPRHVLGSPPGQPNGVDAHAFLSLAGYPSPAVGPGLLPGGGEAGASVPWARVWQPGSPGLQGGAALRVGADPASLSADASWAERFWSHLNALRRQGQDAPQVPVGVPGAGPAGPHVWAEELAWPAAASFGAGTTSWSAGARGGAWQDPSEEYRSAAARLPLPEAGTSTGAMRSLLLRMSAAPPLPGAQHLMSLLNMAEASEAPAMRNLSWLMHAAMSRESQGTEPAASQPTGLERPHPFGAMPVVHGDAAGDARSSGGAGMQGLQHMKSAFFQGLLLARDGAVSDGPRGSGGRASNGGGWSLDGGGDRAGSGNAGGGMLAGALHWGVRQPRTSGGQAGPLSLGVGPGLASKDGDGLEKLALAAADIGFRAGEGRGVEWLAGEAARAELGPGDGVRATTAGAAAAEAPGAVAAGTERAQDAQAVSRSKGKLVSPPLQGLGAAWATAAVVAAVPTATAGSRKSLGGVPHRAEAEVRGPASAPGAGAALPLKRRRTPGPTPVSSSASSSWGTAARASGGVQARGTPADAGEVDQPMRKRSRPAGGAVSGPWAGRQAKGPAEGVQVEWTNVDWPASTKGRGERPREETSLAVQLEGIARLEALPGPFAKREPLAAATPRGGRQACAAPPHGPAHARPGSSALGASVTVDAPPRPAPAPEAAAPASAAARPAPAPSSGAGAAASNRPSTSPAPVRAPGRPAHPTAAPASACDAPGSGMGMGQGDLSALLGQVMGSVMQAVTSAMRAADHRRLLRGMAPLGSGQADRGGPEVDLQAVTAAAVQAAHEQFFGGAAETRGEGSASLGGRRKGAAVHGAEHQGRAGGGAEGEEAS